MQGGLELMTKVYANAKIMTLMSAVSEAKNCGITY
jgi:hypothetical protein